MTTESTTTPVPQDEVLAQLRTRGFEEGFQRTPLKDFWGILTGIGGEMRPGARGPFLVALYDYDSIEVIETTEPYESPIAQIEMPHSSRARSRMGYFGASIDKVINSAIPPEVPFNDPSVKSHDYLIGKRCHLKITPGHMIWNQQAGEERPTECWVLTEIQLEGTAAPVAAVTPPAVATAPPVGVQAPAPAQATPSVAQEALKELDGKNLQQWHQTVFSNPVVKLDVAFVQTIISGEFLAAQEAAGIVTKDGNDIYHVKK